MVDYLSKREQKVIKVEVERKCRIHPTVARIAIETYEKQNKYNFRCPGQNLNTRL